MYVEANINIYKLCIKKKKNQNLNIIELIDKHFYVILR